MIRFSSKNSCRSLVSLISLESYGGDIEAVRQEIKKELEKIFERELQENQRRKLLKDWNGNLDKKSDRDDKLNQLLS